MKIYTKTGDKGETGYLGGRVAKYSNMINLLGELDELNSYLGVVISRFSGFDPLTVQLVRKKLEDIQATLFEVGATVAHPEIELDRSISFSEFLGRSTEDMEADIDDYQKRLQPLRSFILPGGAEVGALTHLARSICRKCERTVAKYVSGDELPRDYVDRLNRIQAYLNRLSDWLFVVARFMNMQHGSIEKEWKTKIID